MPGGRPVRIESEGEGEGEPQAAPGGSVRIGRARLLKRVFDIDLRHCPNDGAGELTRVAPIVERAVIAKILVHLGLDPFAAAPGGCRPAANRSGVVSEGRRCDAEQDDTAEHGGGAQCCASGGHQEQDEQNVPDR